MAATELETFATSRNLSLESTFIPWQLSRKKDEKTMSLNWTVRLKIGDRTITETDYSAGCAHAPSYRQKETNHSREATRWECSNGFEAKGESGFFHKGKPIEPKLIDVLYSLALDSDAIDYPTFEEWASSFGYDTDSRKAEAIYRACLQIGLALRNGLGDDGLRELREAAQDY